MKSTPLVSVVIASYNRARFLPRSIGSILDQSFDDVEVILVDDGSTDNTAEVAGRFPQVQYIKKENGGAASARNAGFKIARGKYIATLDSDDYWEPAFLEQSVNKLEEEEGGDFVFSNYRMINENRETGPVLINHRELKKYFTGIYAGRQWITLQGADLRKVFWGSHPAPSSGVVYRKSSIRHEMDTRLKVDEDWEFCIALIMNNPNAKVAFNKEVLWKKYEVGDNLYDALSVEQVAMEAMIRYGNILYNKYRSNMSREEKTIFNRLRAEYLLNGFLYCLGRKDYAGSFKMLYHSFVVNPALTINYLQKMVAKKMGFAKPKS